MASYDAWFDTKAKDNSKIRKNRNLNKITDCEMFYSCPEYYDASIFFPQESVQSEIKGVKK